MAKKKVVKGESGKAQQKRLTGKAKLLSTKTVYEGKIFRVEQQCVREPGGVENCRDIVKHNGSVVVLAVDDSKSKKDPLIIMERQFRLAAGQFLLELPAGKMEKGEKALAAAKREMIEETGYRAKKWTKLVRYYASPGFLGEFMEIWLARDIREGVATPEEDEKIEILPMKLSELIKMRDEGKIYDGKTIVGISIYEAGLRKGKF